MPEFILTSTGIRENETIPKRFTCDGDDVSPDIAWEGAPVSTQALVLLLDDPDAPSGDFVHWAVLNISPSESGSLPLGYAASPDAPQQGTNDFGNVGYGGPCPPRGQRHRYRFTLYALDAPLSLQGAPEAAEIRRQLDAAGILDTATLTATFQRG